MNEIVPQDIIQQKIFLIRGHNIIFSIHLTELYGVETRVLNQSVKRNIRRFPDDFMFRLNNSDANWLISQNVIPHKKYFGGHLPYAFTEQGVAMLSSLLNSERAILVNIAIMRTFVKLRKILSTHKELADKLSQLERKIEKHDKEIKTIFDAIRQLMTPPEKYKNGLVSYSLPIRWLPCFGANPYVSKWRFKHKEILEACPLALQNYFLYGLRKIDPRVLAPLSALSQPIEIEKTIIKASRLMWSTSAFIDALNQTMVKEDDTYKLISSTSPLAGNPVFSFLPVRVSINYKGIVQFENIEIGFPKANMLIFKYEDEYKNYEKAMTQYLKNLFEHYPESLHCTASTLSSP